MSMEYDTYLKNHIDKVQKALHWMVDYLDLSKLSLKDIGDAIWNVTEHDASKYTQEEYEPYDAYFYGGNRSHQVMQQFNYAWLHHIHSNPHHWQYWILVHDEPEEGFEALEIPPVYILEMIADWWAFSWDEEDGGKKLADWYYDRNDHIIMNKKSRKLLEDILDQIRDVSDEMKECVISHSDISDEDDKKYGLPELKKYPMPDADHVRSAIKFFNYVDPKDEKELAAAILARMKEYNMDFDNFGVGDGNRFKKYIPKKNREEDDE